MPRERRPFVTLGAALVVSGLALALWRMAAAPSGPVEPAWDRVPCARCHMLVSNRAFAAQLHTDTGEVRFFDDPGCLLLFRAEANGTSTRAWFHDSAGEGWLAEAEARFVPAAETPMGHGYAAVSARRSPGAPDAAATLAALRAREGSSP